MKIIKKTRSELDRRLAHDGEGIKKVFADDGEVNGLEAITLSCLEPGKKFSWHNHEDATEMFFIMKGTGKIVENDGEQTFAPWDFFIIPKGVYHEIENTGNEKLEGIFIRVK